MHKTKTLFFLFLCVATFVVPGCADKKTGEEGVTFKKIAGYDDPRGGGKIRIYTFTGEPELEDIKTHVEKLGCGMLFSYYYPTTADRSEIPVERIEAAKSLLEAREILYTGEGVSRWHFGSQCMTLIPSVTNCMESPISSNCR